MDPYKNGDGKSEGNPPRMERSIIGLRWDDKVTNSQVRMLTRMEDVGYKTKKLKGKFAEHVAREVGQKWNQKILNWRPYESMRNRGRFALRWSDELKKESGSQWQRRAQDRRRWKTSVETYAQKMGKCVVTSPAAPVNTLSK